MIKLINTTCDEHKPYTAIESIEMTITDESSLPDVLEAFEKFLKASGYHIPEGSYIDIVQDEENMVQYTLSNSEDITGTQESDTIDFSINFSDDYGLNPTFRIVE